MASHHHHSASAKPASSTQPAASVGLSEAELTTTLPNLNDHARYHLDSQHIPQAEATLKDSLKTRGIKACQSIPKAVEAVLDLGVGGLASLYDYSLAGIAYCRGENPLPLLGHRSGQVVEYIRQSFNNLSRSEFNQSFAKTWGFPLFTGSVFGSDREFASREIDFATMMELNAVGHISDATVSAAFDALFLLVDGWEWREHGKRSGLTLSFSEFRQLQQSDEELKSRKRIIYGAEILLSTLPLIASNGLAGASAAQKLHSLARTLSAPLLFSAIGSGFTELSQYDPEKGLSSINFERLLDNVLSGWATSTCFAFSFNAVPKLLFGLKLGVNNENISHVLQDANKYLGRPQQLAKLQKIKQALRRSQALSDKIDLIDSLGSDLRDGTAQLSELLPLDSQSKRTSSLLWSNPIGSIGRLGTFALAGGSAGIKSSGDKVSGAVPIHSGSAELKYPKLPHTAVNQIATASAPLTLAETVLRELGYEALPSSGDLIEYYHPLADHSVALKAEPAQSTEATNTLERSEAQRDLKEHWRLNSKLYDAPYSPKLSPTARLDRATGVRHIPEHSSKGNQSFLETRGASLGILEQLKQILPKVFHSALERKAIELAYLSEAEGRNPANLRFVNGAWITTADTQPTSLEAAVRAFVLQSYPRPSGNKEFLLAVREPINLQEQLSNMSPDSPSQDSAVQTSSEQWYWEVAPKLELDSSGQVLLPNIGERMITRGHSAYPQIFISQDNPVPVTLPQSAKGARVVGISRLRAAKNLASRESPLRQLVLQLEIPETAGSAAKTKFVLYDLNSERGRTSKAPPAKIYSEAQFTVWKRYLEALNSPRSSTEGTPTYKWEGEMSISAESLLFGDGTEISFDPSTERKQGADPRKSLREALTTGQAYLKRIQYFDGPRPGSREFSLLEISTANGKFYLLSALGSQEKHWRVLDENTYLKFFNAQNNLSWDKPMFYHVLKIGHEAFPLVAAEDQFAPLRRFAPPQNPGFSSFSILNFNEHFYGDKAFIVLDISYQHQGGQQTGYLVYRRPRKDRPRQSSIPVYFDTQAKHNLWLALEAAYHDAFVSNYPRENSQSKLGGSWTLQPAETPIVLSTARDLLTPLGVKLDDKQLPAAIRSSGEVTLQRIDILPEHNDRFSDDYHWVLYHLLYNSSEAGIMAVRSDTKGQKDAKLVAPERGSEISAPLLFSPEELSEYRRFQEQLCQQLIELEHESTFVFHQPLELPHFKSLSNYDPKLLLTESGLSSLDFRAFLAVLPQALKRSPALRSNLKITEISKLQKIGADGYLLAFNLAESSGKKHTLLFEPARTEPFVSLLNESQTRLLPEYYRAYNSASQNATSTPARVLQAHPTYELAFEQSLDLHYCPPEFLLPQGRLLGSTSVKIFFPRNWGSEAGIKDIKFLRAAHNNELRFCKVTYTNFSGKEFVIVWRVDPKGFSGSLACEKTFEQDEIVASRETYFSREAEGLYSPPLSCIGLSGYEPFMPQYLLRTEPHHILQNSPLPELDPELHRLVLMYPVSMKSNVREPRPSRYSFKGKDFDAVVVEYHSTDKLPTPRDIPPAVGHKSNVYVLELHEHLIHTAALYHPDTRQRARNFLDGLVLLIDNLGGDYFLLIEKPDLYVLFEQVFPIPRIFPTSELHLLGAAAPPSRPD